MDSIAHHSWVVDNVKAVFEFLHSGFLQQFIIQTNTLRMVILLEHVGCPQTTHHSYYVLVVFLVCLATEFELLLFLRDKKIKSINGTFKAVMFFPVLKKELSKHLPSIQPSPFLKSTLAHSRYLFSQLIFFRSYQVGSIPQKNKEKRKLDVRKFYNLPVLTNTGRMFTQDIKKTFIFNKRDHQTFLLFKKKKRGRKINSKGLNHLTCFCWGRVDESDKICVLDQLTWYSNLHKGYMQELAHRFEISRRVLYIFKKGAFHSLSRETEATGSNTTWQSFYIISTSSSHFPGTVLSC